MGPATRGRAIAQKTAKRVCIQNPGKFQRRQVTGCKENQVIYYGKDPKRRVDIEPGENKKFQHIGEYRPMNRIGGISESISLLSKMPFETASQFIVETAMHRRSIIWKHGEVDIIFK